MKEGISLLNNIPEEEQVDMETSPVTAEEMQAEAEAMRVAVESVHVPDGAPVDLIKESSPVPEIGIEVIPEEIIPIPQEGKKEDIVQEAHNSDENRLHTVRAELNKGQQGEDVEKEWGTPPVLPPGEIPDDGGEGDFGGERRPRLSATSESELTYKKCEKCKGAGRLFGAASFIPFIGKILDQCSECDGTGKIVSGKRARETIYHY